MQENQGLLEWHEAGDLKLWVECGLELTHLDGAREPPGHGLSDVGLWQRLRGGVHRRQGLGQLAVGARQAWVHHRPAKHPALDLAAQAQAAARRQLLGQGGIGVEKPHRARLGAVSHLELYLPLGVGLNFQMADRHLNVDHLPVSGFVQRREHGFVFVAIGQMQCQIERREKTQLVQSLLSSSGGFLVVHGCSNCASENHTILFQTTIPTSEKHPLGEVLRPVFFSAPHVFLRAWGPEWRNMR